MPLPRGHRSARPGSSPCSTVSFSFGPQHVLGNIIIISTISFNPVELYLHLQWSKKDQNPSSYMHFSGTFLEFNLTCMSLAATVSDVFPAILSPFLSPHKNSNSCIVFYGLRKWRKGRDFQEFLIYVIFILITFFHFYTYMELYVMHTYRHQEKQFRVLSLAFSFTFLSNITQAQQG